MPALRSPVSPSRRRLARWPSRRRRALGSVALAGIVLGGAYAWLARDAGRIWIWDAVVHESGRYTFGQTVLYASHFLREVPIAAAYALFAVAAMGATGAAPPASRRRAGTWALAAAAALPAIAVAVQLVRDGAPSPWVDLLQFRTRDDLRAYGSHWRFHALSTVWAGVAATTWAGLVAGRAPSSRRPAALRIAWGYVALATLVFGVSPDIVLDPRFVGHQAREILYAGTVVIPLLVGVLALAAAGPSTAAPRPRLPGRASIAVWVLVPAYLGLATVLLGSMESAQAAPASALVAGHYWEHTLDLAFGLLLAVGLWLRSARGGER